MLFSLNNWQLALLLAGIMFGATFLGLAAGRSLSRHADGLREPFGVVQSALLTLVALVLAFGLAMAVGRYDARRSAVVNDANAIGTAYLRAQTLREPARSLSLPLYAQYADASLSLSRSRPGSPAAKRAIAAESALQRRLWSLAGEALDAEPIQSGPRLYVESLNEMIDMQTTRVSALNNRVPSAILLIEVIGAATALWLWRSTWRSSPAAWSACCSPPDWSLCCSSSASTSTGRHEGSSRSRRHHSSASAPRWSYPRRPRRPPVVRAEGRYVAGVGFGFGASSELTMRSRITATIARMIAPQIVVHQNSSIVR